MSTLNLFKSYTHIDNCFGENGKMSQQSKPKCPRCNRSLRYVNHGDREFWRCVGWFDTSDPCFAAYDQLPNKNDHDLEELLRSMNDDEKLH